MAYVNMPSLIITEREEHHIQQRIKKEEIVLVDLKIISRKVSEER